MAIKKQEESKPRTKNPEDLDARGVINAQRLKAGWTNKEIIAGAKDEVRTKVKEIMESKFGKDYDKPAIATVKPPKGKVFTQSSTAATKRMPDNASQKIEVLNKTNPHQPESNRAEAFNHMLKSKTVAAYIQGGKHCKAKYLPLWVKDKLIKLV